MKSNALSDKDITGILKQQGIKLNGIFMKDQLPKKLKKGFYVINLASETDNNGGTHWTTLYYSSQNSFYYDAFGFLAPVEVENKTKSYIYSTNEIQDINSSACGFYCIAFIIYMNSQKNKMEGFKNFVHQFSKDTKKNDEKLYDLLYK